MYISYACQMYGPVVQFDVETYPISVSLKFIKTYILVLTYLHLIMSFSYSNNIFIQSLGKYFSLGPVVNDTFQVFKFPFKNHTFILLPETRKAYIFYNLGKFILYWFMNPNWFMKTFSIITFCRGVTTNPAPSLPPHALQSRIYLFTIIIYKFQFYPIHPHYISLK